MSLLSVGRTTLNTLRQKTAIGLTLLGLRTSRQPRRKDLPSTELVRYNKPKVESFMGEILNVMDNKVSPDISFTEYIRFLSLRRRTILSLMVKAVNRDRERIVMVLTDKLYDVNDLLAHSMESYYLLKHPEAEITYQQFLEKVVEENKARSNT
jgi:hypothetical protein